MFSLSSHRWNNIIIPTNPKPKQECFGTSEGTPPLSEAIAVEVLDSKEFFDAEPYHQHYAEKPESEAQYKNYRSGSRRNACVAAVWKGRKQTFYENLGLVEKGEEVDECGRGSVAGGTPGGTPGTGSFGLRGAEDGAVSGREDVGAFITMLEVVNNDNRKMKTDGGNDFNVGDGVLHEEEKRDDRGEVHRENRGEKNGNMHSFLDDDIAEGGTTGGGEESQ